MFGMFLFFADLLSSITAVLTAIVVEDMSSCAPLSTSHVLSVSQQVLLCLADLLNVFETFLPQLLLYPNPTDPLNGEAAALLMREPEAYNAKVKGGWLAASSDLIWQHVVPI